MEACEHCGIVHSFNGDCAKALAMDRSRRLSCEELRERYEAYMRSGHWSRKKRLLMAPRKYTCERCGAKAKDVHHKTYERFGNERYADLEALCRACHNKEHGIPPGYWRNQ